LRWFSNEQKRKLQFDDDALDLCVADWCDTRQSDNELERSILFLEMIALQMRTRRELVPLSAQVYFELGNALAARDPIITEAVAAFIGSGEAPSESCSWRSFLRSVIATSPKI